MRCCGRLLGVKIGSKLMCLGVFDCTLSSPTYFKKLCLPTYFDGSVLWWNLGRKKASHRLLSTEFLSCKFKLRCTGDVPLHLVTISKPESYDSGRILRGLLEKVDM